MIARIFPLREEEIPAAAALEALCFTDGVSEAALRSFVLSESNRYYAAHAEDGTAVGYGGFSLAADEAEILTVAVSPVCRRSGIGRALTERMLADAALCGASAMYLEVRSSNTPARALYVSLGFEEIGVRCRYYRNPTEDAVLMKRALVPSAFAE